MEIKGVLSWRNPNLSQAEENVKAFVMLYYDYNYSPTYLNQLCTQVWRQCSGLLYEHWMPASPQSSLYDKTNMFHADHGRVAPPLRGYTPLIHL